MAGNYETILIGGRSRMPATSHCTDLRCIRLTFGAARTLVREGCMS